MKLTVRVFLSGRISSWASVKYSGSPVLSWNLNRINEEQSRDSFSGSLIRFELHTGANIPIQAKRSECCLTHVQKIKIILKNTTARPNLNSFRLWSHFCVTVEYSELWVLQENETQDPFFQTVVFSGFGSGCSGATDESLSDHPKDYKIKPWLCHSNPWLGGQERVWEALRSLLRLAQV